jgi:uncharacterized protein
MDKSIINFISNQKTASICCLDDSGSQYCFSVFFVFDKGKKQLYFKSSANSLHSSFLQKNIRVAGTILPDKLNLLAIRGVQFTGFIQKDPPSDLESSIKTYHKTIPFTLAMPGEVWTIQLETVKFTDNSLGFGKKILWERENLALI